MKTQRIFDISIVVGSVALAVFVTVLMLNQTQPKLVSDWLSREGGAIFNWWLLVTLAGAGVFPLLYRLMPSLPSRGYALARAAGLMLTGFIFWFLASLGFLTNSTGSILFAWLVVIILSVLAWTRRSDPDGLSLQDWFKDNWALVVVTEILFVVMLVVWAGYRAHEPEIRTTEKPMEMMFINSIRQSENFPPNDAWLAGYSISYYYFGYVIVAGLADLSGVNTGIAFGLIGPLLFALSGIGILGVVYDLVRARPFLSNIKRFGGSQAGGIAAGLLGVFFLVIMGNLGTFLIELPYNGYAPELMDFFEQLDENNDNPPGTTAMKYFEFWDVPERSDLLINQNPGGEPIWGDANGDPVDLNPALSPEDQGYLSVRDANTNQIPDFAESALEARDFTRWGYWWWFRYSRVVKDSFLPRTIEDPITNETTVIEARPIGVLPIDEFPHFSFVLLDIHPHVLALPFTLLAIGLTVGLALREQELEWWGYVLLAIWVGGMIFMNSWDAVFLPFLVGGEALRRLIKNGRLPRNEWGYVGIFALIISGLTFGLYLPWILSFTSQASGFYLNVIWPTTPQQLFLQFGGFFLLLIPFLIREVFIGRHRINWTAALGTFAVLFVVIVVALPMGAAAFNLAICDATETPRTKACEVRDIVLGSVTPDNSTTFWGDLLERRMGSYLSEGLILLALVFIGFRLFARPYQKFQDEDPVEDEISPYTRPNAVALLILAAGLVLVFAPDFIYLVDNFSVRINTIFKLYYQGWIFFSVAAAYGVYAIFAHAGEVNPHVKHVPQLALQGVFGVLLVIVIWMGLMYPYYASRTRGMVETNRYAAHPTYETCMQEVEKLPDDTPESELQLREDDCAANLSLTLDGRARGFSQEEFQVVQCLLDLNPAPGTVIAEAPFEGGYRPEYGRVAMLTGIPNLLGWQNHERQWRGSTYDRVTDTVIAENGAVVDSRPIQLDRLYQSDSWEIAQSVINRYGIDYIMVGQAEHTRYADFQFGLEKFADYLKPVCQAGNVTLYQVN